jgi:hypothetical protein
MKQPAETINYTRPAETINYIPVIVKAMALTDKGGKISQAQRRVLANAINRITIEVFENDMQAGFTFISLIALESAFKLNAKSTANAVGLAQVIPKYSKEFLGLCGVTDVSEEDVINVYELNILAGACQFRKLLEQFDGNTALALVAYNAGANSMALKEMSTLRAISNMETANYVGKAMYIREVLAAPTPDKEEVNNYER